MNQPSEGTSKLFPVNTFEAAKQSFANGVAHFEAGQFDAAQTAFESSLALLPGRASTLGNLGATHIKLGQPGLALPLLDQALALEPRDADAWYHRGQALADLGRPTEALASFDRALALLPECLPALYQRCLVLCSLQRYAQALQASNQILALDTANEPAWWQQAEILNRLNRKEDALAAYDQLIALNPALDRAFTQQGSLLKDLGRVPEAISAFEQALALGGDAELNGYFLASLASHESSPVQHHPTPQTAPRMYVESLFDDYADEFDAHLVGLLGYRAHSVLVEELVKVMPVGQSGFKSALDLGCGTGLCGPLVKPLANRLAGVDLSAAMLQKARALGVYDTLSHSDLSEYLADEQQRHDLVLSADVFIYVGALEGVFSGVARVLEAGGVFCFSVEKADDTVDWQLTPGMRYAHSARYLRALAVQHGFEVLQMRELALRNDQRQGIGGLFVYLLKR